MKENKIVKICPVCKEKMVVKQLYCQSCKTEINGTFSADMANPFDEEEWAFIIEFLICEGNLKCLSERVGISYPTIKNRLYKIKEKIPGGNIVIEEEFDDFLDKIDKGEAIAKDLIEKMKRRNK